MGRSKTADLARILASDLGDNRVDRLTQGDFIAYVQQRRKAGAGPATAGNDLNMAPTSVPLRSRGPAGTRAPPGAGRYR